MNLQVALLLQVTTVLISVYPTDNRRQPQNIPPKCQKKFEGPPACGEFREPHNEVGNYDCKFNQKKCAFSCVLKCPENKDGFKMIISDNRYAKDLYICLHGIWQRHNEIRPQAYCTTKKTIAEVSQNLHHVPELNSLVHSLFNTSYLYLGMVSFYERADVALPGFGKFMTELWEKELKHARDIIAYINKRGGYLHLIDIPRPNSHEMLLLRLRSRPGLVGLEKALGLTRDIGALAQKLHAATAKERRRAADPHLKHYLEDGLITDKVVAIEKLSALITQLKSFDDEDYDVGEYIMDVQLRN